MDSRNVNRISEMLAEKLISPVQCKGARSMLGLSQQRLAKELGISDRTIHGFEKGTTNVAKPTQIALRKVLENKGARFIEHSDGSLGVIVKMDEAA